MSLTSILAWTLLHFVWQGALLAAGLALLLPAMRRQGAQARYRAGVATMALMVVAPIVTASRVARSGGPTRTDVASVLDAPPVGPVENTTENLAATPPTMSPAPDVEASHTFELAIPPAAIDRLGSWAERGAPLLVGAWLAGVIVLSIRFGGGWLRVRRLTREHARPASPRHNERLTMLARRLGIVTTVRLLESALVEVPTVVGWLRPVVLVPLSLETGLSPRDLELLLAHELAHIRRQDYLVNLLQTVVETVLFYHPGVWWVSRQVREEREHCCDDIAVALCEDRQAYAKALLHLEELRQEAHLLAVAATGGNLVRRIQRLVMIPTHHAETRTRWAAIPLGAAALVGIGGWAAGPSVLPTALVTPPSVVTEPARTVAASVESRVQQLRGAAPDTVIRYSGTGSLEERWAWAESAARRRGSRAFWIGYAIAGDATRGIRYIDRHVPVFASGSVSMGSMRLNGSMSGLTFQGVKLDSLLGPSQSEDQVVLLGFVTNGGRLELDRIHASAFILPAHFAGRTLYWVGRAEDAQSIAQVRRQFERTAQRENRHDLIDVVGMHLDGGAVMQTLRAWLAPDYTDDIRAEVAEELSEVATPEALVLAARLARTDRSRSVQREAAEAVGEMDVTGALDTLADLARTLDARDVRSEAVEGLGERRESRAIDILVRIAWEDRDGDIQREAIETIGETHDRRALRELERLAREHPTAAMRQEAVETLGEIEEPAAVLPILRRLIEEDASSEVRREAIETMGELQTGAARDALKDYARTGRDAEVRREAMETLASEGNPDDVLNILMGIINGSAGETDQAVAVEELGDVDDGRVVSRLSEIATTHPSIHVRRTAVEELGDVDQAAAHAALLRIIGGNVEPSLKRVAIETYADAAPPADVLKEMQALLRNATEYEILNEALEALEDLDDGRGIPAIIEVARSHANRDLRRRAFDILGDSDDPRAHKEVARLLEGRK